MTTYQKESIQEKTIEEYEAAHTNYFGCQQNEEDSLDKALQDHFQRA